MKIKPDLYLKGVFMGIAEIIPGVSGGTIAFITGIYEELINKVSQFKIAEVTFNTQICIILESNKRIFSNYFNFWNVDINFDSFKIHCVFNR